MSRDRESTSRQQEPNRDVVFFGPFRMVAHERLLERDGSPIPVGSRAFDLLLLLVGRQGEVISKSELMAKAWPGLTVDEGSLRFHIAQLRRALGDGGGSERYVVNVPGRGYCFVAPVSVAAAALRKQAAPADGPGIPGLPPRPTRILGRNVDLGSLAEQLSARRFITLRGPGGIGKTTVAIALAHEVGHEFKDGTRFLDLGCLKDPQLVAIAAASALKLLVPVEDPTPRLIESLRDRHLLLLFDNCEHVVEAVAQLAEQIYQHAPNVFLLATSRESLGATGEFVFELTALEVPPEDIGSEAELLSYSSARLLMECATAAGYTAPLTEADTKIVASICRKLDGIPLAIELVASRLSVHGLVEVDALIEGRLRLAWRGRRTAPLRHQSLSAALDWSYDLISPVERTLLESLSIFPGSFNLQGAHAVAGDLSEVDSLRGLEQLVAKSFVTSRPSAGQARFRLLGTTRAYADEKLTASGGARVACLSHARYVLQALTPRSYEPGGDRPGGWSHRAELLSDARAALAWAYSDSGEPELRIPLAAVSARLFVELNLLQECREWAGRALALPESAYEDRVAKVELLWAFGHAAMFTEQTSYDCEAALRRGLELAQEVGDPQNEFRLLSRLHAWYRRTGERSQLMQIALRAEAIAARIGDPAALSRAQTYIGVAHYLRGEQLQARERLQAGSAGDAAIPMLPVDHFANPRDTNIMSCTNLWLLGFPEQAVAVANGLVDAKSNPDLTMYCGGLCFAARVFRWVGDMHALEEAIDRLANHSRKFGFGPFQTISLALRGEMNVACGAVAEGAELLQQSLPRMLADRSGLYIGSAAMALIQGLAAQGELGGALTAANERINAITERGECFEMPELLRVRGELWAQSGELLTAERDFRAAMELAEAQSALSWTLRAATSLARLAGGPKQGATAVANLRHIYERFVEGFDTADLRAARALLERRSIGFARGDDQTG